MSYDDIIEHLAMLSDRARTGRFQQAINAVVKRGDTVIDFGCGTGILSLFAAAAGAGEVFSIDRSLMIHAAKLIARANGVSSIRFLACEADKATISQKADVLVSEWMGHFALYESMLEPLINLRTRFLKPGGIVIPSGVSFHAAFVTDEDEHRRLGFFGERQYGLDFSFVREWPFSAAHLVSLDASQVDDDHLDLGEVVLRECLRTPEVLRATHISGRRLRAVGLCGWFRATLAAEIEIDTGPFAPPTHWKQVFFPFRTPVEVASGDELVVSIWPIRPDRESKTRWRWRVTLNGSTVVDQNDIAVAAWLRGQALASGQERSK